jgi:hypothetical protein
LLSMAALILAAVSACAAVARLPTWLLSCCILRPADKHHGAAAMC